MEGELEQWVPGGFPPVDVGVGEVLAPMGVSGVACAKGGDGGSLGQAVVFAWSWRTLMALGWGRGNFPGTELG